MSKEKEEITRREFLLGMVATAAGGFVVGEFVGEQARKPDAVQDAENRENKLDMYLTRQTRDMFFQETEEESSYIVQRDDTLFSITSKFFDGDLNALLDLNSVYKSNPDLIHAGNMVRLSPELMVGNISLWRERPLIDNQWTKPGEADPPIEWKDVVIGDHNKDPNCGTKEFPYTVVTLVRSVDK